MVIHLDLFAGRQSVFLLLSILFSALPYLVFLPFHNPLSSPGTPPPALGVLLVPNLNIASSFRSLQSNCAHYDNTNAPVPGSANRGSCENKGDNGAGAVPDQTENRQYVAGPHPSSGHDGIYASHSRYFALQIPTVRARQRCRVQT